MRPAESKEGRAMSGEVCGPEGGRGRGAAAGASGAHAERTRLEGCGGMARAAERTSNMPFIQTVIVTPDVSKLSGWLKFVAPCRGRKQGLR